MVIGRLHHLIPQITGANLAIDPHAIFALVGTFGQDVFIWFCDMNQFHRAISLDRFHERIGHTDRDVEVGQVAFVFCVNEQLDVRVIATHDTHLRAASCTG